MYRKTGWLWTVRGASVINTSNLPQLCFHGYICHSDDCMGIFKSEYRYWAPRAIQAGELVVKYMAFSKIACLAKWDFLANYIMFKLHLNVFFHDLYAWNVFFFLQWCILYKNPCRKTNLNFYKIWEISTEKWVSKVTPRLAKRKSFMEIEIYMIFKELVHAQKQFVELAGHFVVRGEVIF